MCYYLTKCGIWLKSLSFWTIATEINATPLLNQRVSPEQEVLLSLAKL